MTTSKVSSAKWKGEHAVHDALGGQVLGLGEHARREVEHCQGDVGLKLKHAARQRARAATGIEDPLSRPQHGAEILEHRPFGTSPGETQPQPAEGLVAGGARRS